MCVCVCVLDGGCHRVPTQTLAGSSEPPSAALSSIWKHIQESGQTCCRRIAACEIQQEQKAKEWEQGMQVLPPHVEASGGFTLGRSVWRPLTSESDSPSIPAIHLNSYFYSLEPETCAKWSHCFTLPVGISLLENNNKWKGTWHWTTHLCVLWPDTLLLLLYLAFLKHFLVLEYLIVCCFKDMLIETSMPVNCVWPGLKMMFQSLFP